MTSTPLPYYLLFCPAVLLSSCYKSLHRRSLPTASESDANLVSLLRKERERNSNSKSNGRKCSEKKELCIVSIGNMALE